MFPDDRWFLKASLLTRRHLGGTTPDGTLKYNFKGAPIVVPLQGLVKMQVFSHSNMSKKSRECSANVSTSRRTVRV